MYKVTTRYELRKYPDLSGKLGYLEVGTIVDGEQRDTDVFRVTNVDGIERYGYFRMSYLEIYIAPPPPAERYILYYHDGIVEKFVPETA